MKWNDFLRIFLLILFFFASVNACQMQPMPAQKPISVDQMHANLVSGICSNSHSYNKAVYVPRAVNRALLPPFLASAPTSEASIQRFNVSANKIPAKEFYMGLVEGTNYNMVVSPTINGTITLELKDVSVEETLQAVRDVYGYEYTRTAYGFEILPQELKTQIFTVNYPDVERKGKSTTQMNTGQISQQVGTFSTGSSGSYSPAPVTGTATTATISNVDTKSDMDFWKKLETTLQGMIGTENGRSVVVNGEAGVISVRAYPSELHQVARYLDRIQVNMQRQVILEAKILEVQLNDLYQAGIDWNLFGKSLLTEPPEGGIAQTGVIHTFEESELKDFNGIFALNIKGSFGTLIKLLQVQGNVQVLSSPRISTVNNQKAVIKVGRDEFFVTGVSSTTAVAGNTTIPTQNVTLTPFFSGITLDVTPQISKDGNIILHIHPSISLVKSQQKEIIVGTVVGNTSGSTATTAPNTLSLPLALSDIRESDNIVKAKNYQMVVIGGLMQNIMKEEVAGVPIVSKIPFLGTAFRRTRQIAQKTELVILLRPIIVDRKSLRQDMQKTDCRMYRLRRGFHVGGLPEVFGTEAEADPQVCG